MENRWSTDIKSWSKITKDTADLYMSLAESRLDETVETANNTTNKNDKLLAINISVMSVLLGYLSAVGWEKICYEYLPNVSLIAIILLGIAIIYLSGNLFKYKIGTKGEEPKIILRSKFIDNEYTSEEQYINLVLQVCETYQYKIDENHKTNKIRQRRLTLATYWMISLPVAFFLSLMFLWFRVCPSCLCTQMWCPAW